MKASVAARADESYFVGVTNTRASSDDNGVDPGPACWDDLAAWDMAVERLIHRADAGRWGAGLARRAISIAILLIALIAEATLSWRDSVRHLCEQIDPTPLLRHLTHPPASWAAA